MFLRRMFVVYQINYCFDYVLLINQIFIYIYIVYLICIYCGQRTNIRWPALICSLDGFIFILIAPLFDDIFVLWDA